MSFLLNIPYTGSIAEFLAHSRVEFEHTAHLCRHDTVYAVAHELATFLLGLTPKYSNIGACLLITQDNSTIAASTGCALVAADSEELSYLKAASLCGYAQNAQHQLLMHA